MLVQLRDKLVADGEGLNEPEANPRRPNRRGGGGPPESEGLRMRGKRYVEELGRPHALLAVGRSKVGYIDTKARKGKPGPELSGNLSGRRELRSRQAEEYCERESPPYADGESYRA